MSDRDTFLGALDRADVNERAAYLDQECGADRERRQRIEGLLAAHEAAGGFLSTSVPAPEVAGEAARPNPEDRTPAGARPPDLSPGDSAEPEATATSDYSPSLGGDGRVATWPLTEGPGSMIGPYKLLQAIGEGGMGTVFMAEQERPVRRKVALKVIKAGMDTAQVIARFEAERQALALMDHPNIARVLDAGASAAGRPFFVMELVWGLPITRYCDEARLTPRERLGLFLPICQAVHHAHQKGIIHRDIKPSNVLVTEVDGRPVPKIIDFGIAKATDQKLAERTLFTQFGAVVGTPEYMSPEQADLGSMDIDTRSDVYSLGVLLYELLTGTTPLERDRLRDTSVAEMMRRIREEEPPPPSGRLSSSREALPTLAAVRRTEPARLSRLVRGELDWIVMKALEKDRALRYQAASALAADVQRYLDDRPVEARRLPIAGRMRRFARRHKIAVLVTSLVLAAAGIAASFAVYAQHSRVRQLELELAIRGAREQEQRQRWAREFAVPQIERLLEARHVVSAFALAREAERHLPNDPALGDLWAKLAATAAVTSDPPGARVAIRDWDAEGDHWLVLGDTPLRETRLPCGVLRWRFNKDGYVPREMVAGLPDVALEPIRMTTTAETPADMVLVPSGQVALVPGKPIKVGAFWIDRFEVSNRQFQQFVDAGGYEKRRYWTDEFVRDGRALSWDEAMKSFRDRTGRPGPSTWTGGRFPAGKGDYPVQGVGWHEASAFAAFAGKSLPTVAHWTRAACLDQERYILPLSNSLGSGPAPVGSHAGIGAFDIRDMAGNVREWCRNAGDSNERRMTMGGAWDEPGYMFRYPIANSPFTRLLTFGFRCMLSREDIQPELLAKVSHVPRRYELESRATPQQLEAYKHHYLYDRDAPLNARLASRQEETERCVHEVVGIDAAYGRERFDLHIFLPRRTRPPYRTIVFFPGAAATVLPSLTRRIESGPTWDFSDGVLGFVDRGWAVCWPIYWGTYERRSDRPWLAPSVIARDRYVQIGKDLSRTVDYLQSREDIARYRLAYCGFSWGAMFAPVMTVIEPRFRAAVLISGGYRHAPHMPEIEPFQYAPYMKIPTLMIDGQDDHVYIPEWYQLPLYRDLGSEDKMLVVLDAGHILPYEGTVELAHRWLSRTLPDRDDGQKPSLQGAELLETVEGIPDLVALYAGAGQRLEARQVNQEIRKMRRPAGAAAP